MLRSFTKMNCELNVRFAKVLECGEYVERKDTLNCLDTLIPDDYKFMISV